MDWAELGERLRQHFRARVDGFRYRVGLEFPDGVGSSSRQPARFFFSPDAVPSLCSLLKERFPAQASAIVRRAEQVCRHRFDLLGYESLYYGAQIDWHFDRLHIKRAPRKLWFKIHYLDFEEVGDSKIIWELNRHQHFVTLAKAYRLTNHDKFAKEIFDEWQQWHAENPYPIGINWASSLEVAFRSLSWIWTYFLLADSPAMPSGFREDWLRALSLSGRHIENYLSTYFSPNTHLLGEGVALFFIGALCPEIAAAEGWKHRGWEIILQQAARQVLSDGWHFEQSTYYHVYALDFFLHTAVLGSLNDVPIPREFDRTLEKMLEALCLLGRAGSPPRLGDDDGGRVFDPARNRGEHLLDPLSTGAVLFGRADFKSVAGQLREETLWLLGQPGAEQFDRLAAETPTTNSSALPAAGLYLMSADGGKRQLVIDTGAQGASTAGHGHADALSIAVNSNGHPLLIDPGTCEYIGSERNIFRGTRSHNTLVVDDTDQAEVKGPFAWSKLPSVRADGWINGSTFDLFVASHGGYRRLELPVVHHRWVFSLKSEFWLVRDIAKGRGQHQLDIFWHLDPDLSLREGSAETFLDAEGQAGLRILAAGDGWLRRLAPTWWSPAYGVKKPAKILQFSRMATLPTEFVTLLVPVTENSGLPESEFTRFEPQSAFEPLCRYAYSTTGKEHGIIFASREPWSSGEWSSDAEFLYWGRTRGSRDWSIIMCNGSYLEFEGERLFSCSRRVLRCEIIRSATKLDIICSDGQALTVNDSLPNLWAELEPASSASLSENVISEKVTR
jgi:Heparinase II/III-like protein/Heparinase II/III N-terminus